MVELQAGPGQDPTRSEAEGTLIKNLLQQLQQARSWEWKWDYPTEKVVDPETGVNHYRRLRRTEISITLHL